MSVVSSGVNASQGRIAVVNPREYASASKFSSYINGKERTDRTESTEFV